MIIFTLFTCFLLTACSSAPKSKAEPASTPMKSAKTFVRALTTGDEALLNTVIYQSQSMPASEIMKIAKIRKITGMKQSAFTFSKDPKDKDTVIISFKSSEGHKDKWLLVFLEGNSKNSNYQYDGILSGSLLANTTFVSAAKSYVEVLTRANKYWKNDMSTDKRTGKLDFYYDQEILTKYGIGKKKLKDFTFPKDDLTGDYGHVIAEFKDQNNVARDLDIIFTKGEDGYTSDGYKVY